jgi:hypothetical protein
VKQHRHPNAEAGPIEGLIQYHTKRVGIVRGHSSLCAEWAFEQVARPFDRVAEKLIGMPLIDDRLRYFRGHE